MINEVREKLEVSERRACRVLGQPRSTQRRQPYVPDDEPRLVAHMIDLASEYGRYGYRRITALLRQDGWNVNHKRIERLWRREGLKVPSRQPKRGRLWFNDGSCIRLRPAFKDHVWAYDFVHTRTHDGRALRMLVLVDEYSRECLSIDVARQLTSEHVLERLAWLFATRGVPQFIRSDNGSEFTAWAVRKWLAKVDVRTLYIEPGSPWENGLWFLCWSSDLCAGCCAVIESIRRRIIMANDCFGGLPGAPFDDSGASITEKGCDARTCLAREWQDIWQI